MQIGARNVIEGTVVSIETEAIAALVRIEIAPGRIVTAVIANDAMGSPMLDVGIAADVVVEAFDVMLAVE